MKSHASMFAAVLVVLSAGTPSRAGHVYGVGYTDQAQGTTVDLSSAGLLDWVKWGNGESSGSQTFASPRKTGGSLIQPPLTPLGNVPNGQTVFLAAFAPVPNVTPRYSWTDGTIPMAGGQPVGTSVSEAINPAQFSYPLGLGLSFQVDPTEDVRLLKVYVAGFNARMRLSASLSGGATADFVASDAALIPVPAAGGDNYVSYGYFSVLYTGPGESLTLRLTADNQSGIPTNAPHYGFRNAGALAATIEASVAPVPEPSGLILAGTGGLGLVVLLRRRRGARAA